MRKSFVSAGCGVPVAAILAGLSPGAALAQEPPEYLDLVGVVRDFRERTAPEGHPDFERQPDHGFGHYAGTVALFLDYGPKPIYEGNGKRVTTQFKDSNGRNIAPHLYNRRYITGSGAPTQTNVILQDSDGVDAYEIAWVSTVFNADGTSAWTYHVRELPGGKDLSHWNLALSPTHQVMSGTTAGYDLGVDGSTGFYGIKWDVLETFSQGDFVIVLDGHFFGADQSAAVQAKGGNAPDVGALFAPTTMISGTGSPFNTDTMLVDDPSLGDVAGVLGASDNGGVQSVQSFNQWFRDTQGVNMSKTASFRFVRQDDGTYVFDDDLDPVYGPRGGFFPIDGELFGNSGGSPDHNFHFTFELHAEFTYDADGNQFFRFTGDDDVYVFIDGKLAIDLGGVHGETAQYCDLNRMGLVDGETYTLDFFFAERHRTQSKYRAVTNLVLESVELPTISAAFD
jgi:fibro-slime domain-containing protein